MIENFWLNAAWSVLPTLLVFALFYVILRAIVRSDRNERRVYADIEAEERARRGLPPKPPAPSSN
ncbi:hypothetical protein ACSAGD_10885 [Paramicrobacterium sp. CJ85]|uniref:hypothetical protein n=1 Tax=Paramicrobacterium sp. CJ85 TaxID=3445355 RepID=UPI003F627123